MNVVNAVIESGYDLQCDGEEALGLALRRSKREIADRFVAAGVDPRDILMTLFQLSENLEPDGIRWMLDHGADPDIRNNTQKDGSWTPLDNAIHTYPAKPRQRQQTVRILFAAGAVHADHALFDLTSGNSAKLRERLEADPSVLAATFDIGYGRNQSLEFGGQYGGAPLANTTLLHHCAEFGFEDEAKLLIGCGADANAKAMPGIDGFNTHSRPSRHNEQLQPVFWRIKAPVRTRCQHKNKCRS